MDCSATLAALQEAKELVKAFGRSSSRVPSALAVMDNISNKLRPQVSWEHNRRLSVLHASRAQIDFPSDLFKKLTLFLALHSVHCCTFWWFGSTEDIYTQIVCSLKI